MKMIADTAAKKSSELLNTRKTPYRHENADDHSQNGSCDTSLDESFTNTSQASAIKRFPVGRIEQEVPEQAFLLSDKSWFQDHQALLLEFAYDIVGLPISKRRYFFEAEIANELKVTFPPPGL
jgi:hypothetical protein